LRSFFIAVNIMRCVYPLFFVLWLLASCAPVQTPQAFPIFTPTFVVAKSTFTVVPPTTTSTPTIPTPTSTSDVCDPHTVDYCITEAHFIFQRPIKLPDNTSVDVTYRYASTANGTRDPHHGVEFYNKFGTPVFAAEAGQVLFASADEKAVYSPWSNYYGNVVVIQHANDIYTLYAHLSKITVEAGKPVLAGEQIGEVGQSGVAIGSHLHFEVRRGDVTDYFSTENPELWLVPNLDENGQPFGALQISVLDPQGQLVKRAEFTLQYLDVQSQPAESIFYGVTYSADMRKGPENAGIGDLRAGEYRLVVQYNGQHLERWVAVESGKLTQVVFDVK
jgi:hypothetical protein